MDVINLAAGVAVVVVAAGAYFWWRARRERARLAAIRRAQAAVSDDEAFLDSSHISGPISGLTGPDAAARAASALRRGDPPAR